MKTRVVLAAVVALMTAGTALAGRKPPRHYRCIQALGSVHEVYVAGHGEGGKWLEDLISRGEITGWSLAPREDEAEAVLKVGDAYLSGFHYVRATLLVKGVKVWQKTVDDADDSAVFGNSPRSEERIVSMLNAEIQACKQ